MNEKERQEKLLKMMEEEQNQSWSGVSGSQVRGNESSSTVQPASKGDGEFPRLFRIKTSLLCSLITWAYSVSFVLRSFVFPQLF